MPVSFTLCFPLECILYEIILFVCFYKYYVLNIYNSAWYMIGAQEMFAKTIMFRTFLLELAWIGFLSQPEES